MIKTERTTIIPFDMKYLDDYFNLFDAEITKYQWPDPFDKPFVVYMPKGN